jgi:hypothetical protein
MLRNFKLYWAGRPKQCSTLQKRPLHAPSQGTETSQRRRTAVPLDPNHTTLPSHFEKKVRSRTILSDIVITNHYFFLHHHHQISSNPHLLTPSHLDSPFTALAPYSGLNILRAADVSPSSSLSPAGLAGLLKVTLSIGSPNLQSCQNVESKCNENPYTIRSLEQRYCILLDGVLTFLPPTAVTGCCNTRAVGSMENRSLSLSGYVTKQVDELTISLKGSKGECTTLLLECTSPMDRFKWCTALTAHVEHVDSKVGSKWLF